MAGCTLTQTLFFVMELCGQCECELTNKEWQVAHALVGEDTWLKHAGKHDELILGCNGVGLSSVILFTFAILDRDHRLEKFWISK